MAIPKKQEGEYTYGDYLTWGDDERCEIIDGKIYMMAAPTTDHQLILMELSRQFANYLVGKPCKVFVAPFDVRIPKGNESDIYTKNVVQPDMSIICDSNKLNKGGCFGSPDFVLEILSESTSIKDRREKFRLYEKGGVREYWILHPAEKWVTVYLLENGKYIVSDTYNTEEKIKVHIFPDFEIDLLTVFGTIG